MTYYNDHGLHVGYPIEWTEVVWPAVSNNPFAVFTGDLSNKEPTKIDIPISYFDGWSFAKAIDMFQGEDGWFDKQLDIATERTKDLPDWARSEAGLPIVEKPVVKVQFAPIGAEKASFGSDNAPTICTHINKVIDELREEAKRAEAPTAVAPLTFLDDQGDCMEQAYERLREKARELVKAHILFTPLSAEFEDALAALFEEIG